jgi:hypothetical protein
MKVLKAREERGRLRTGKTPLFEAARPEKMTMRGDVSRRAKHRVRAFHKKWKMPNVFVAVHAAGKGA